MTCLAEAIWVFGECALGAGHGGLHADARGWPFTGARLTDEQECDLADYLMGEYPETADRLPTSEEAAAWLAGRGVALTPHEVREYARYLREILVYDGRLPSVRPLPRVGVRRAEVT